MKLRLNEQGFSLIELLIVVAIIGIIATIAVPQLMNALDRGRQKRTMADMRNIAAANGTYRVDTGDYATDIQADLESDYMQEVPDADAWNNAWVYTGSTDTYTLESNGADGADGPAAPDPWTDQDQEYDADLVMTDGTFTEAPGVGSTS